MNGRTWVEREDWIHVGRGDRPWDPQARWENSAPKKDLERCQAWLASHGLELVQESLQLGGDGWQHRLYVGTREIAAAIDLELRDARIVDECARAKREGRAPDLEWLDREPDYSSVAQDYDSGKKHLPALERKYGIGRRRLKRIIESQKVEIRENRRMRISERVGPERSARALRVHDQGGSLEDVRRDLGVATRCSARRFLRRHGRDTRPREERAPPAPDPPVRALELELLR